MAFAMVAVFSLTFVSCGSDGDEPGPSSSLSEYVGTWSTITGIADGEFEYIQFKSDGNCTRVLYDEDAEKGYDVFSEKEKDKLIISLLGITSTLVKVNDNVIKKYLDGENIRTDEDASFSFTINGKNYYYGETYTYPGIGLKISV